MPTNRELLQQMIAQRAQQEPQEQSKIQALLDAQDAALRDTEVLQNRTNLKPAAAFIDSLTGSNLSRGIDKPQTQQEALRQALQSRLQTPKTNLLAALQTGVQADQQDDRSSGLRQLTASNILKVQEGQNLPNILADVSSTINDNSDLFGPITGRKNSLNPYNVQGQTVNSQMSAASQAFGRFMEGGVLRKEDELKYRKMFPQLSDTPEVAHGKLAVVSNLLNIKQKGDVQALEQGGFDTAAFQSQGRVQPPQQPSDGSIDVRSMTDAQLKAMAGGN